MKIPRNTRSFAVDSSKHVQTYLFRQKSGPYTHAGARHLRVGRENGRSSARAIGGDECVDGGVVGPARALSGGKRKRYAHGSALRRPTDRPGVSIRVRCFDGDGCGSTSSSLFFFSWPTQWCSPRVLIAYSVRTVYALSTVSVTSGITPAACTRRTEIRAGFFVVRLFFISPSPTNYGGAYASFV